MSIPASFICPPPRVKTSPLMSLWLMETYLDRHMLNCVRSWTHSWYRLEHALRWNCKEQLSLTDWTNLGSRNWYFGTRGFSRLGRDSSVSWSTEGRSRDKKGRVTIKTWPKPETAHEKSLASTQGTYLSATWQGGENLDRERSNALCNLRLLPAISRIRWNL